MVRDDEEHERNNEDRLTIRVGECQRLKHIVTWKSRGMTMELSTIEQDKPMGVETD